MAQQTLYVLDSNIFIEAKKRYYRFQVCPGFWDALLWQHSQGAIVSIDRVKAEIEHHQDDLKDWTCNTMPGGCFKATNDEAVTTAYGDAIKWVMGNPQFTPEARALFSQETVADAWVIAYAKAHGATVVTEEKLDLQTRKRVKIPNVCQALGVPYMDTFDMLSALSTRFSWQQP
ncbi:MAG TPA: DUF4411 family protein [Vicinamibacterales bacterium]|nr:DUF4411 family protein [Vicinamibacterales bacterium]